MAATCLPGLLLRQACFAAQASRCMSIMTHYTGRVKAAPAAPPQQQQQSRVSESITAQLATSEPAAALAVREPAAAHGLQSAAPAEEPKEAIAARLLKELEAKGELHAATLRAIEDSEEWQDYDAHVSFELAALRHRYISTDAPMTSARRAQMQAHLRQKQQEIMEAHATREAARFIAALTPAERTTLQERFLRLDAAGTRISAAPGAPSGSPGGGSSQGVGAEALKEALWDLSQSLAEQERGRRGGR